MEKRVLVASRNPVKVMATEKAFRAVFREHEWIIESHWGDSGVPEQPIGIDQTFLGARNRVENLKDAGLRADYYVGIEGGIYPRGTDWFAFAWMYVESAEGKVGKAQTGHFPLPSRVAALLAQGFELGDANDKVFGLENSKQKMGAVGMLTNGLLVREEYYRHALILALIPFTRAELFPSSGENN